ncbi:hypothetical protein IV203_031384 [Nitzschia inconspicua]|uniref:Uncharacterized protein n=1 Tax=Nitzschia inconspicua TaxID=303405 RepID=A0A9K3LXY7_9STRA|nr:hypothetical protein IV203_031384 [Nitzschia inconspicua]
MSSEETTTSSSNVAATIRNNNNKNIVIVGQHRAPEETVHMNVLGRDASDNAEHEDSSFFSSHKSPTRSQRTVLAATATSLNNSSSSSRHHSYENMDVSSQQQQQQQVPSPTRWKTAATPAAVHPLHDRSAITGPDSAASCTNSTSHNGSSKWFSKLSWGNTDDNRENDHTNDYECLKGPSPRHTPAVFTKRAGRRKISPSTNNNGLLGRGLLDNNSSSTDGSIINDGFSTASSGNANITIEDQLRQDCSFFYQGMDGGKSMNIQTSSQLLQQQQQHGPPPQRFLSSTSSLAAMSRRRVMSSRDGALFMNRYEQLNQDMNFDSDDEWGHSNRNATRNLRRQQRQQLAPNDLFLDENVDFSAYQQHNPDSVITDGMKTSSLFYEQNGRVLMRLPRDMVKLIMDHDLEPGILSVEQWRRRDEVERQEREAQRQLEQGNIIDPLTTQVGGHQHPPTTRNAPSSSVGLADLPELHYVMTVPDDLYRRVVSEISMEVFPPYWGFFKCCNHESDRADIKLALAILGLVLFLLMVGSIEWPTD